MSLITLHGLAADPPGCSGVIIYYIPAHQGSRLPDGTACTSVSGVFSALAHLSTAYTSQAPPLYENS